jgi:hypothetical protein
MYSIPAFVIGTIVLGVLFDLPGRYIILAVILAAFIVFCVGMV